ncbi:unnamed protein product, partial [Ectocarpus sp. 8 AP-2014]
LLRRTTQQRRHTSYLSLSHTPRTADSFYVHLLCSLRAENSRQQSQIAMRAKEATTLISFLAPSAAFSFCVLPHRNAQQQRCTRSIFSDRPPQGCTCSSAIDPKCGGRGRARLSDSRPSCSRHVVMAATAGEPDTATAAATTGDTPAASAAGSSSGSRNPRQRVSRALNRTLGNVLATGDMFGSVSNGVSDDSAFGGHFTSTVGQEDKDDGSTDEEEEEEEEGEDIEDEGGHANAEDLPAAG